ncbi:alpha/beta fold hydrolase [Pseudonocardia oroxyli]|uniref:Pimeloyl-ACP methyl ester carboxylesterase n=1 Tax=Pseudonocardia oroxyli TaxID=366584 RepID=A0A1G7LD39_PSEOR|nr:alpha/beta hydrolase [Pseudonocardia oroxyli]SDF47383.1 Pimeloyl-ACP methyl ester carboxylesterase [Pseudonocardia oroxyli]
MIRYTENGDVRLAYERFGEGEPLLLIMGLDFQMVWWPDGFVQKLVEAGFAVVRFDNRDTGLSTSFAPVEAPKPFRALLGRVPPVYTARDMLDDALAVVDAQGWSSAHVMGGSMGAALAQGLAAENPERVRSVISAMGAPAGIGVLRTLRYLRPGVFRRLARLGSDPEEQLVEIYRAVASPGYPFPEEWAREAARISHERHPRDQGTTQRQLAAGRAHRFAPLATITAPTLVLSGRDDPLIRWQAGRDTARAIPGARFVCHPGMGHAIPAELYDDVVGEIVSVTSRG